MKIWPFSSRSKQQPAIVSGTSVRVTPPGELRLPAWARLADEPSHGVALTILADTDGYVEEWLGLLTHPIDTRLHPDLAHLEPYKGKPDQYWLEVAYQCAKLDLQRSLLGTQYDPRIAGMPVEFKFNRSLTYALSRWPKGRAAVPKGRGAVKLEGAELATQGREAREHYKRIRGALPF